MNANAREPPRAKAADIGLTHTNEGTDTVNLNPPPVRGQLTLSALFGRLDAAEVAHRNELVRLAGIDAEAAAALTPGDLLDAGIRRSWAVDRVARLAADVAAAERAVASRIASILTAHHTPSVGGDL